MIGFGTNRKGNQWTLKVSEISLAPANYCAVVFRRHAQSNIRHWRLSSDIGLHKTTVQFQLISSSDSNFVG